MTSVLTTDRSARRSPVVVAGGLVAAVVVAVVLNTVVAAIAHAAGASNDFIQLHFGTYAVFTVIGVLLGAAGWAIVRARSSNPPRVLRVLVPAVLVISFVPDILLGANGQMAGSSWGAVLALMAMHLVVAAVAIPTYLRVLPVSGR